MFKTLHVNPTHTFYFFFRNTASHLKLLPFHMCITFSSCVLTLCSCYFLLFGLCFKLCFIIPLALFTCYQKLNLRTTTFASYSVQHSSVIKKYITVNYKQ